MADDVSNASIATDVIAADDVGGVKFQRIKLALGAEGTYVGDVSKEHPLPITNQNGSVTDVSNVNVVGTYTSGNMLLDNASYRCSAHVIGSSTGVVTIAIETSQDGINYETYYQNRYGFSNGSSVITLPVLPVQSKYIRYVISTTANITISILRNSFANNAKECRQVILSNPTFSSASNTTTPFKVLGIKYLSALVGATVGGIVEYRWELSLDGVNWLNGSGLCNTSPVGVTCSIATNYGYSFARLIVLSSTATANPETITLHGVS